MTAGFIKTWFSMKQNIYDDEIFFTGYYQLRKEESGLNKVLEIPAFRSLWPQLSGAAVLDLGCGFGDNCYEAINRGAENVTGVDISESMLQLARAKYKDPKITFVRSAMEDFEFLADSYDVVLSSLALHYIRDFQELVRKIFHTLKGGGCFIFSIEHPMCTARAEQQWAMDNNGNMLFWPVDGYRDEGMRSTRWFVDNVIKYHRTIETYVNTLIDARFRIKRLTEPEAPDEFVKENPALLLQRRRPPFLLLSVEKTRS